MKSVFYYLASTICCILAVTIPRAIAQGENGFAVNVRSFKPWSCSGGSSTYQIGSTASVWEASVAVTTTTNQAKEFEVWYDVDWGDAEISSNRMRGLTNGQEFAIAADHFYQNQGDFNESFSIKVYLIEPETGNLIFLTESKPKDGSGGILIRNEACVDSSSQELSAARGYALTTTSFLTLATALLAWAAL